MRRLLWVLILLLAIALRAPAVTAGLPYTSYVDEGHFLHRIVWLSHSGSGWDPEWYLYPSLPFYAVSAVVELYKPVYEAVHGHPMKLDLSPYPYVYYDLVEPVEIIVLARLVTLAFGLGLVVMTGLLARRMAGPAAGMFAALLAAVLPAFVMRGAVVTVDPVAAFFTAAAVFFAEGAVRGERPFRDSVLAGLMTGCALTSKYPSVMVGLAVVVTLLGLAGGWRRKARAIELATLAGLLAAVVTMPALVLKNEEVMTGIAVQSVLYQNRPMGAFWDQALLQAEWDQPFQGPELGWAFVICAGLGWLLALADRRSRWSAVGWMLFAALLSASLCVYPFRPFRNLLSLVPLACVLVAILFAKVREKLPSPRWADAAAAAALLALFLPSGLAYARGRLATTDSRVEAVDWLAEQAGPGDRILVASELSLVKPELARLRAETEVLTERQARRRLRRRTEFDWILTGNFGRGDGSLKAFVQAGRPRDPYELALRVGEAHGGQWKGSQQVVLVYRRKE